MISRFFRQNTEEIEALCAIITFLLSTDPISIFCDIYRWTFNVGMSFYFSLQLFCYFLYRKLYFQSHYYLRMYYYLRFVFTTYFQKEGLLCSSDDHLMFPLLTRRLIRTAKWTFVQKSPKEGWSRVDQKPVKTTFKKSQYFNLK